MKIFKGRVEKSAGERMRVDMYPASQLGPIPRMIEGVQLGTIEIAAMPIDFLAGVDKRYTLVGAPAVFDDVSHGFRALHDPRVKELFWQLGDAKNFTTVGMTCDTPTTYVGRRPMKALDDFQGKKIRVFANVAERETLRRLGAAASPMPIEEVMMALTTGVIDAAKGTVTVWYPFKYYGVAKHILRTNEALICVIKIASRKWLQGLPTDLRQTVLTEAIESDKENMPFIVEFVEKSYQQWTAAGGEIFDLSPAERTELRQKLASVGDFVVESDPDLKPAYALLKEAAARTRR
jgi:TRAP-type C4-dicarboxylate transport system substrate-binding protein